MAAFRAALFYFGIKEPKQAAPLPFVDKAHIADNSGVIFRNHNRLTGEALRPRGTGLPLGHPLLALCLCVRAWAIAHRIERYISKLRIVSPGCPAKAIALTQLIAPFSPNQP